MKPQPSLIRASAVYLIFAISGASALVYQVLWARWLGLVFGNTTLSISIVLGSFMMGLALGSWIAGRFLDRIENPMFYYALLELGIGIFALCFPVFSKLADILFRALVDSEALTGYSLLIRAILSSAVLLVPTTFMGATLPLLTDFFHRAPRHTKNWKVGLLYAANTFGAAVGILAASFLLIELFGVLATTFVAAGLNFLVAILGLRFSRAPIPLYEQSNVKDGGRLDSSGRFAVAVVTVSGLLALASEVLWTRTLETIIGNSTYAFATIVFLFLLGIAAGSWIMSLVVNRLKALPVWLAGMLLGMGLWQIVSIRLFELVGSSLVRYSMRMVPLSTIFGHYLKAMGVLLPLALLSGACFPLATRIIDRSSEDAKGALAAKVYAWNTVGALIGSLTAGFIIAPHWDLSNSLYLLAGLYCFSAFGSYAAMGISQWHISYRVRLAVILGGLAMFFSLFSFYRAGDDNYLVKRFNARNTEYGLVFHKPGLQGVTSVLKPRIGSGQDRLLVNGLGMTAKITDTKMMAHLPMLLHPAPENTLVICFGMGTTYRSALSYGKKVTAVELVGEVVDAFDYFFKDAADLRAYPGGRIVVNDGRNFLKITREKFDVITLDPPPPIDAAGVNSLHSREFIELAKEHLNKGGIMAHWMPYPGRGLGVDDIETLHLLVRTFAQVFPYTYIHESVKKVGLHVIGSMEPVDISVEAVRNKLLNAAVLNDLNEWDSVPADFIAAGWQLLPEEWTMRQPGITDDEPYLEFYLLRTLRRGEKKMHPVNSLWK